MTKPPESMASAKQWWCLQVGGRVQGVGFRPFVHRVAQQCGLAGSVANTGGGVEISLYANQAELQHFVSLLRKAAPAQARIETLNYAVEEAPNSYSQNGFSILPSQRLPRQGATAQIAADMAVCQHCLDEFHSPHSRRFHDPFINCSDCGPRYSMVRALPYDRAVSSMAAFVPCEQCQREFNDPCDRRFHTQGICCPQCGPKVTLYDRRGQALSEGSKAVEAVAGLLKSGRIVAFKGVGGFHLLVDARNAAAVAELRRRKRRHAKPFAVLCKDVAMAHGLAVLSQHETALLSGEARPIVLVEARKESPLCAGIAPDLKHVGLLLAYAPLQHLLFESVDFPLVATSANISGEPILYQLETVLTQLCAEPIALVDAVLDYNREIYNPCDDSLVQSIHGETVTLRLGRGLAPVYLPWQDRLEKKHRQSQQAWSINAPPGACLAVGAQQKSSLALLQDGQAVLAPYLGDLGSLGILQRFETAQQRLLAMQGGQIGAVVSDLHPHYDSRRWAQTFADQQGAAHRAVQHHYAHALACMAEHDLHAPALAFIWDGTGLGDDGTLWGGEVLLADRQGFERLFHLETFKLIGGEAAVLQPRRAALAWLFKYFALTEVTAMDLPVIKTFTPQELQQFHRMHRQDLNCPLTTSMGRVFDAAASLLDLVQELDYEGQSGLLLESYYDPGVKEAYAYRIAGSEIILQPMWTQMLQDLSQRLPLSRIVSRFFNVLVNVVTELAAAYPSREVIVGGGVFQNRLLLSLLLTRFHAQGRTLYFQHKTPINDGAIALGQLAAG
jgi:hydrogenase maturation protein HypF